jgi:hypothetical protein
VLLAGPVGLLNFWRYRRTMQLLPMDALVHICVAWAVGGLMAYLNDWYRRQMFANQKLAACAHDKELLEARARIKAQRALAAAQVGGRGGGAGDWVAAPCAAAVALPCRCCGTGGLCEPAACGPASWLWPRAGPLHGGSPAAASGCRRLPPCAPPPAPRRPRPRSARCPSSASAPPTRPSLSL